MNRIAILLVATVVIGGCSRPGIKGDGVLTTTNRTIADFSALEVTGAYQIKWSSGQPTLTISTDQNLLPLIKTSVTGNTLHIDWEENLRPTKGITIHLSSASLADVRLTGAVRLTASKLSGSDLKLESNGASSISVEGSVTNLDANLSGASKLDAKSLQTQTTTVSLNGAAYADVTRHGYSQCLYFRGRLAHLFRQPKIGGEERQRRRNNSISTMMPEPTIQQSTERRAGRSSSRLRLTGISANGGR